MSNYLSFLVAHPEVDLNDKDKCEEVCQCLFKRFEAVYGVYGDMRYSLDMSCEAPEMTIISDAADLGGFLATVYVYSDYFVIDPFHDDWEMLLTDYVGITAREMIQALSYDKNELWYLNDYMLPVVPWRCDNLMDFLSKITEAVGGHIPVIDTEEHTIDSKRYYPDANDSCQWIIFHERFDS